MRQIKLPNPIVPFGRYEPNWKTPPCFYCGKKLRRTKHGDWSDDKYTLDHVIPRAKGGDKKVPCCLACNRRKGDRMPTKQELIKAGLLVILGVKL